MKKVKRGEKKLKKNKGGEMKCREVGGSGREGRREWERGKRGGEGGGRRRRKGKKKKKKRKKRKRRRRKKKRMCVEFVVALCLSGASSLFGEKAQEMPRCVQE